MLSKTAKRSQAFTATLLQLEAVVVPRVKPEGTIVVPVKVLSPEMVWLLLIVTKLLAAILS